MGAIRRSPFVGVLVGSLVALVPGGPAVAVPDACADRLTEQLQCWAGVIKDGPVVITLDEPLAYEKVEEGQHQNIDTLRRDRYPLVVRVPKGGSTGEGGTALLVLAEGRLVHPDARIDRLRPGPMRALKDAGLCVDRTLMCELIESKDDKSGPLDGRTLIDEGLAADLRTHVDAIGPAEDEEKPSATASPGTNAQQGGEKQGGNQAVTTDDEPAGYSSATWTAFWMCLLLALLLLAFVIVIRRSRGPVAVGHRAVLPGRAAGGPARTPPAHAARGALGGGAAPGGAGADGGDEATTRLRVSPTPRYGRQVGPRPAHSRTAVVRTELHPQGYVELDRVLRRAVWAEPGRPPPAPGGLVDVTDARERDSDVLYAFPPTAARHAKGTPR
ncbi:hypothetical protein PV382_25965 [Streptomyces scabiei]|uniref:hypothetical protein n=1 Tax=Streptomyces scabiei TaxID=1930 RepID=UPI0029A6D310|nr:hypothetical protein [Streptomyces scabiei]MDX2629485.1 hypothetical protein [Streptomyces scabiei]MDX2996234.1 hypothetical protein [Streptomyces scabiei]MDX3175700.1 hypothetical protein [Streptomyces scabiei]